MQSYSRRRAWAFVKLRVFGGNRDRRSPEVLLAVVITDALEAVFGLADVGGWLRGVVSLIADEEVNADATGLILLPSPLELLPWDLSRLYGAARDLGNPDAAGVAIGKIDLNGLRAGTGHV
jgi:hypothetical protein